MHGETGEGPVWRCPAVMGCAPSVCPCPHPWEQSPLGLLSPCKSEQWGRGKRWRLWSQRADPYCSSTQMFPKHSVPSTRIRQQLIKAAQNAFLPADRSRFLCHWDVLEVPSLSPSPPPTPQPLSLSPQ